jgi:3-hydroxy-3-methylglutaryl CoA synthase/uncharacterized OB-fold protein
MAEQLVWRNGIVAYGTYVPYWRLDRQAIAAALNSPAGRGTRAVASYDEDTTTMGVEAARLATTSTGVARDALRTLAFATVAPAYLDKSNAAAVHAALGLDASATAFDVVGSVRSGLGALQLAANTPGSAIAVLSDIRTGNPGGADETNGGDGAAAFVFGGDRVIAEPVGFGSATAEFLDRWRQPGDRASRVWEERFGEHVYVPLAEQALTEAFKDAGISAESVDHLIVAGVHPRAARVVVKASGVRPEAFVDDLASVIGNAGTAQPGILLADVLDRAAGNEIIALVVLDAGATVVLLKTTEQLAAFRTSRGAGASVAEQVAAGRTDLAYPTFLTWRDELRREPPRRPDPTPPAAPPSYRKDTWKFAFAASRCTDCGTRHLPPVRVCVGCGSVDHMGSETMADVAGTVKTFTVDRLTFSMSPPVIATVVDFDGGGRLRCELTDADPNKVAIGDRVEMTFRRVSVVNGISNYAWKARPSLR